MLKRLAAMALVVILAISLCGCGKDKYADGVTVGEALSGDGGARLFSAEPIALPQNGMVMRSAIHVGDWIVLCAEFNGEYQIICIDIDSGTLHEVEGLRLDNVVNMDSYGDMAYVITKRSDGGYRRYNIRTQLLDDIMYNYTELEVPPELSSQNIFSILFLFDTGSELYETADRVYIPTPSGVIETFGPYSGNLNVFREGDDIFIVSSDGASTKIQRVVRKDSDRIAYSEKESWTIDGNYTACFGGSGSEIYGWNASDPNILYNINYTTGAKNAYANLFSSGASVVGFTELGASRFFAAATDGQPAIWTVSKNDDVQVITLATCSGSDAAGDQLLRRAVTDFNNSSPDYRIDILDYSSYNNGSDKSAGYNRLNADIAAGSAPDIYDLWSLSGVNYASKGLLADLKPWFDNDSEISYDDLVSGAASALEDDGHLYQLVPSYSVVTVFTTAERFGSAKHMSVSEFLDAADRLGAEKMFGSNMTRERFLSRLITYTGTDYIDRSNASCSFDTPEFARMLKFIARLPAEKDDTTGDWENIYFGDQYLYCCGMDNVVEWLVYSDAVFGGIAESVGFPSTNGSGVAVSPQLRLGMSSSSDVQDGVWQFFKYMLGDSFQSSVPGVPLTQRALDAMMVKWCEALDGTSAVGLARQVDGQVVNATAAIAPPDETTMRRAQAIIDSADCVDEFDGALYNIIWQEVNVYLGGGTTAEAAAQRIQERASLYLSEQYA